MKLFLIKFFFIFFSVLTLASEKIKRRGKKNDVSGFKFFEKNKIGNKEILFEGFFTLVETTNNVFYFIIN